MSSPSSSSSSSSPPFLPSSLPLLPLAPPHVLFPFLRVSIPLPAPHLALVLQALAENARAHKLEGAGAAERVLGVVPVVEIERRVGRWATAARIRSITRAKDSSTYTITLEGIARVRLPRSLPPVLSLLPPIPLYSSPFALPLPVLHSTAAAAQDLAALAAPLLPPGMGAQVDVLPTSLLCDLLASVLGMEWEGRVEMLGMVDLDERAERVRDWVVGMLEKKGLPIPENAHRKGDGKPGSSSLAVVPFRPLPTTASSSTSPPSSRRSAAATSPAPGSLDPKSLPEDLHPLLRLYTARTPDLTGAAYHAIHRELARLAKIPAQSAEYGVTKTYLELLLALPWKRVSADQGISTREAERRLEEGHEGLKEVKRRVVEYLAVHRLKKRLFDDELARKEQQSIKPAPSASRPPIDASTAAELLELIPPAARKDVETPLSPTIEDGPPVGVYRDKGPILLLVGPPGVGKTSISRSLADCMGRKFHRISLGGVRDEAEIRGHRRTYVGALPGLLVQALRKVQVSNPVILLDELDKIASSPIHGDPAAALLEALDPAQNWGFHDHYLGGEVPVDLSQAMFIATANTLDTIPPALLDRCEVIECGGYTVDEKVRIAERFLLRKQVQENGLKEGMVRVDEEVLRKVIEEYTRESGVRSLERQIGKLIRSKAVEYSHSLETSLSPELATPATTSSATSPSPVSTTSHTSEVYTPTITPADVERILGLARFDPELAELAPRPGVVHGLSYKGSGMGGVLVLEAVRVPGGTGKLHCTGRLGEVIHESAELALTWVRSRTGSLSIDGDSLKGHDIHLHLPSGSIKKDGPSAGIAMVIAFVSLLTDREVPATTAFTGEITLRGAVTPVGGIKEKVLGAHRAGIKRIILSARNLKDVQADVPEVIRREIAFRFVHTIEEALVEVWGEGCVLPTGNRSEARL